jgi:hypothetical protein
MSKRKSNPDTINPLHKQTAAEILGITANMVGKALRGDCLNPKVIFVIQRLHDNYETTKTKLKKQLQQVQ